jgi:hypothetical protein
VRTLTKVVNGVGYVFAYNYTNAPQPVTFAWQGSPTSVTESKSGQSFVLNGASWSDTFAPYQARIYVVNGAPPPPPSGGALTLSFTNPASGATVSATTTVTMTATGSAGYTFAVSVGGTSVYGGTNPTFSWNTTTVANGARTLIGAVTDANGTTATATLPVTVSNTPPPPPPPPSTGFTVSFSYPTAGATVSGSQTVGLSTTAAWGQSKTFALAVDGASLTSQSTTGTTLWYTWDTTATANGPRTLTATVTLNGQTATATLPVTVSNATPPTPTLTAAFTAPASGATVGGTTTVALSSSGASGSSTFQLAVDGGVVSTQTVTGTTASYPWNTTTVTNGAHTLTLTVTDGGGRVATATLPVTVSNVAAFTASITYPAAGATVSGSQSVGLSTTAAWGQSKTFTLSVDGKTLTTQKSTATTLWYTWSTKNVANGVHTLTLSVTLNGQTATTTLPVTVKNK